jgi:hypothetical protein
MIIVMDLYFTDSGRWGAAEMYRQDIGVVPAEGDVVPRFRSDHPNTPMVRVVRVVEMENVTYVFTRRTP